MEIWRLLRLVQQAQSHSLDFEDSYNLTSPQFSVLSAVVSSPGLDQRSVSAGTFIDKSTLVGVIGRLLDRGLIYAVRDPSDGRRDCLLPSRAAIALLYEATPELLRRNDVFLSVLPDDKAVEVLQCMEVVGFRDQEDRRSKYVIPSPDGSGPPVDVTWGPGRLLRASLQRYGRVWSRHITAVTPQQAAVLSALSQHPGLSQRSVSEMLGINKASMAEMLARLAGRNLVSRTKDPLDGRRRLVRLLPDGKELMADIKPLVQRVDAEFLSPLEESRRALFLWGLDHLVRAHHLAADTIESETPGS